MHLEGASDLPYTDETISVAGEESGTIGRPGEGDALGVLGLLTTVEEFRAELINNRLGLEIPNLDARVSGSAQPVAVGRESESVDDITSLKGVEVLGVVQVPEHDNSILATRGAKRTVRRNSDSVNVASVTNMVGSKLALGKLPDLDNLVPSTRNNDRVCRVRREADAGDPLGVTIFGDVVLALSEGVPQFDGSVTGTRHDLTVVGREGDREDIVGMANEATGGGASVQIPEADSLVPGGRESKLAIRGDGNILNEMVVTKKRLAGNAIVGFIPCKIPDDDRLVAR